MDDNLKIDRYYNLSLRYLSYRPRSEKEMYDYLKKKKLADNQISEIIQKLNEYNFLDDEKFAKLWVETRLKSKNKPIWVIERELKQKGIKKDLIDEALPSIDDKKSLDLASAKSLAQKKSNYYRKLESKKRNEKVMNYLLGKGFSYDIAKKAINT